MFESKIIHIFVGKSLHKSTMNISKIQMDAIASLLTKEDKQVIATKAGNSLRTVESVLLYQRHTETIQKLAFQTALAKWDDIGKQLNSIALNNPEKFITLKEFRKQKESALWTQAREYFRYLDVYLQLSNYEYKNVNELWEKIKAEYSDVIQLQAYCIDLIARVCGITDELALKFYNSNF